MTLPVAINHKRPAETPLEDLTSTKRAYTAWSSDCQEKIKNLDEEILNLEWCTNLINRHQELDWIDFRVNLLETSEPMHPKLHELKQRVFHLRNRFHSLYAHQTAVHLQEKTGATFSFQPMNPILPMPSPEAVQAEYSPPLPQVSSSSSSDVIVAPTAYTFEQRNGCSERSTTDHVQESLKKLAEIQEVAPPKGLSATLRTHQQEGLNWLQSLSESKQGGILADDMGLGKTIQTLAHLQLEKEKGKLSKPALVVAPKSVVSNWKSEAEKFTPQLRVLVYRGDKKDFARFNQYDLIITSYNKAQADENAANFSYSTLILDEAQAIKSPQSKRTQQLCQYHAEHRLCLTGTPFENNIQELWSLFNFVNPGLLGSLKGFNIAFGKKIAAGNQQAKDRLIKLLSPFILRRQKKTVTKELPPITERLEKVVFDRDL